MDRPRFRRQESEDAEAIDPDQHPFADISEDAPYEYIRVKPRHRHQYDDEEEDDTPQFSGRYKAEPSGERKVRRKKKQGRHREKDRGRYKSAEEYSDPNAEQESEEDDDDTTHVVEEIPVKVLRLPKKLKVHKFRREKVYHLPAEAFSSDKDYVRLKVWPQRPSKFFEDADAFGQLGDFPARPNYNPNVRPVSPAEYSKRVTGRDNIRGAHQHHSPKQQQQQQFNPTAPPSTADFGTVNVGVPGAGAAESSFGYYGQDRPPRWSSSYMMDESSRPRSRPQWEQLRHPPPQTVPPRTHSHAPAPPPPLSQPSPLPTHSRPPPSARPPKFPGSSTHIQVGSSHSMPHPYLLDIVKKYPVKIRVMN